MCRLHGLPLEAPSGATWERRLWNVRQSCVWIRNTDLDYSLRGACACALVLQRCGGRVLSLGTDGLCGAWRRQGTCALAFFGSDQQRMQVQTRQWSRSPFRSNVSTACRLH